MHVSGWAGSSGTVVLSGAVRIVTGDDDIKIVMSVKVAIRVNCNMP